MPNEHRADPTPPPHHGQGRGGSKKESSSLRVSQALHPPERPSPRRADIADHGLGRETREYIYYKAGRPGSSEVPRNPLTRWDVSSIPANGIFLTKKLKNKNKNAQRVKND